MNWRLRPGFAVLALSFTLIGGCSTYQGPKYNTPASYSEPQPEEEGRTSLSWPLPPGTRMSRGFIAGSNPHNGIDFNAPVGTMIRAAHEGVVVYSGHDFNGFGNLLIIEDGTGWATFYAHLSKFLVYEGATIKRGQKIAKVGRTGNATGPHLHFELRRNKHPVDPMQFFP